MNYRLIDALNPEQMKELREIYEVSFPENEKKPFELIMAKVQEGKTDVLAIADSQDTILGLLIAIPSDSLILIDYFAVHPEHRGEKIGSSVLAEYIRSHPEKTVLLEIEDPDALSGDSLEARRQAFYQNCGFRRLDWKVDLFGVRMAMLSCSGSCSFDAYSRLLRQAFHPQLAIQVEEIRNE